MLATTLDHLHKLPLLDRDFIPLVVINDLLLEIIELFFDELESAIQVFLAERELIVALILKQLLLFLAISHVVLNVYKR